MIFKKLPKPVKNFVIGLSTLGILSGAGCATFGKPVKQEKLEECVNELKYGDRKSGYFLDFKNKARKSLRTAPAPGGYTYFNINMLNDKNALTVLRDVDTSFKPEYNDFYSILDHDKIEEEKAGKKYVIRGILYGKDEDVYLFISDGELNQSHLYKFNCKGEYKIGNFNINFNKKGKEIVSVTDKKAGYPEVSFYVKEGEKKKEEVKEEKKISLEDALNKIFPKLGAFPLFETKKCGDEGCGFYMNDKYPSTRNAATWPGILNIFQLDKVKGDKRKTLENGLKSAISEYSQKISCPLEEDKIKVEFNENGTIRDVKYTGNLSEVNKTCRKNRKVPIVAEKAKDGAYEKGHIFMWGRNKKERNKNKPHHEISFNPEFMKIVLPGVLEKLKEQEKIEIGAIDIPESIISKPKKELENPNTFGIEYGGIFNYPSNGEDANTGMFSLYYNRALNNWFGVGVEYNHIRNQSKDLGTVVKTTEANPNSPIGLTGRSETTTSYEVDGWGLSAGPCLYIGPFNVCGNIGYLQLNEDEITERNEGLYAGDELVKGKTQDKYRSNRKTTHDHLILGGRAGISGKKFGVSASAGSVTRGGKKPKGYFRGGIYYKFK
jgi:hypothetical protein